MTPSLLNEGALINGRYTVVRQVGRGGMGAVYEATDTRLGNSVALKQTLMSGEELERAFVREARLLSSLRHSALPVVSDYFADQAGQFLVMQYIPGDDLATLLSQRAAPFPVDQVLAWADQLCDALDYLHTQSPPVIHRDIKPQNMKLTQRGEIVLLDFGLAKSITTDGATTSASVFGYTPLYAPLEQIRATGTDTRSDFYSLGATLYALLSGMPPANVLDRAAAALERRPDPLRPLHEINPAVTPALSAVIIQAMALNPADRPANAGELRRKLAAARSAPAPATGTTVLQGIATEYIQPELTSHSGGHPNAQPAWLLGLMTVGVVALLGLGGWGLLAALSGLGGSLAGPEPTAERRPTQIVEEDSTPRPPDATPIPIPSSSIPSIIIPTFVIPTIDIPQQPTSAPSLADSSRVLIAEGTGQGRIDPPNRLALDGEGNIFVADYIGGRIQKFKPDGTFLFSWVSEGDRPLLALAVSRDGRVMASRNNGVQVYDGTTGNKIGSFAEGGIDGYSNLIVLPDRSMLAVIWAGDSDLIRLDAEGNEIGRISSPIEAAGGESRPSRLATDGLGTIYALDATGGTVFVFRPDGKFIDRFEVAQPNAFGDILVAPSGQLFVSAFREIVIFEPGGRQVGSITKASAVFDMVFTDAGDLLTVSAQGEVVLYDLP